MSFCLVFGNVCKYAKLHLLFVALHCVCLHMGWMVSGYWIRMGKYRSDNDQTSFRHA